MGAAQNDEKINQALAIYNRAKYLHREGRLDEAIQEYKAAVKLDKENPWIFNAMGLAMTAVGDFKGAEKAYQSALKLHAELSDVHNNLGVLYSEMGLKEKAFAEFTKVIRDPSYPTLEKALYNMGSLYYREQNYELAMMYYRRSVEKKPKFAMGYRGMGEVHVALEEPELAAEQFAKALENDPNDVPSLYELARIHDGKGEVDQAREYYRRVVEADRFSTLGKISLGRLEALKPGT
jgi:Tfp pilus assembly protein PilF